MWVNTLDVYKYVGAADITLQTAFGFEGDIFPREGVKVADERLAELSGSDNKRGIPLIEKVEEEQERKPGKQPGKKKEEAASEE